MRIVVVNRDGLMNSTNLLKSPIPLRRPSICEVNFENNLTAFLWRHPLLEMTFLLYESRTMDFEGKKSKRGRMGEGRPTKRTPEVVAKIAEAVAIGLTDEEASLLAEVNPDTMTEWRKDPEFSGAIKKATAQRLLLRLERIEAGEQGWQGTAWALERIYPHRFARPEVMNQIAVVNQGGKASAERIIVLPRGGV